LNTYKLLATFRFMSRRFTIEVAKDYFNFASAHFLVFSNGQREALHGHNYQVAVTLQGELDRAGVVLDFITFKPLIKRLCDELDHRTLIQSQSPSLRLLKNNNAIEIAYKRQRIVLPKRDVLLLPLINTSTELLAEYIAKQLQKRVRRAFPTAKINYIEVGVEETRGQRGIFQGEF
jgi:6-pyruvoyltetrahydropterin/6-carboxytetrahydropterin synthase